MKIEPISNWRSAWKFASIQIAAIGVTLLVVVDNATAIWSSIPPEVAILIPHSPQIATGILVVGAISRLFKLKEKDKYGAPE
jgi:hypothetical protein